MEEKVNASGQACPNDRLSGNAENGSVGSPEVYCKADIPGGSKDDNPASKGYCRALFEPCRCDREQPPCLPHYEPCDCMCVPHLQVPKPDCQYVAVCCNCDSYESEATA